MWSLFLRITPPPFQLPTLGIWESDWNRPCFTPHPADCRRVFSGDPSPFLQCPIRLVFPFFLISWLQRCLPTRLPASALPPGCCGLSRDSDSPGPCAKGLVPGGAMGRCCEPLRRGHWKVFKSLELCLQRALWTLAHPLSLLAGS